MANPSLQIGNSNWAIKEDNLLGYSTAGTRFVPQPITMTRASAGTRVNSSGLVETVELLGSEEITGFTNGTSYPFSTFTTSGNNITSAIISSSFAGAVSNSISIVNGKTYKVTFTYTKNSGDDLRVLISNSISGAGTSISNIEQVSASGDITLFFTATSTTTGYLQMGTGNSGHSLNVSITNVSVKESTKNNLARVDYDGTASSLLVEPMSTNTFLYSEPTASQGVSSGITYEAHAWDNGFTNCIKFGDNSVDRYYYGGTFSTVGAISFFVEMDDGSEPFVGGGSGHDFSITINGALVLEANTYKENTIGNVWKIWATDSGGSSASSNGIWKRTANSTKGFRQVGLQLESLSYATSYIPTDGGTVTRVQDQYSKTGISNLINSTEGVLFLEIAALTSLVPLNNWLTITDGTNSNSVDIVFETNGKTTARIESGGVLQAYMTASGDYSQNRKIAFKWKVNDFAFWIDGVEVGSDTNGITFSADTLNSLQLNYGAGGNYTNCKVKQLQVFKTADIDLAALTS